MKSLVLTSTSDLNKLRWNWIEKIWWYR